MDDEEYLDEFAKDSTPIRKSIKEAKVNTSKPVRAQDNTLALDKKQKDLVSIYKSEPKMKVRVAPSYAKYFGRVMNVSINGIIVAVKCDGHEIELPESFASEVIRRMNYVDENESRCQNMSQISKNYESSAGQLDFFGR